MKVLETGSDMYRLVGFCMTVRHALGNGFSEGIYEQALAMELRQAGFDVRLQVRIPVYYKGVLLNKSYVADMLINNTIIVELKAVRCLGRIHEEQVNHYLEATNLHTGLLVNFGNPRGAEWRVVSR